MKQKEIRDLHRELENLHGEPDDNQDTNGVEQLVATILSQGVADENTARAMDNLLKEYSSFREVEEATVEELSEVVRPAGLQDMKARRIHNALRKVREETGGYYSLSFIEDYSTDDAQDWLEDIKGVGPKTASVVLSFHFGKPAFPVDTHIHRICSRYGLISEKTGNEKAHKILNAKIPDDIKYDLHMLLISHGREYCSAQSPDCENSVCKKFCDCEFC